MESPDSIKNNYEMSIINDTIALKSIVSLREGCQKVEFDYRTFDLDIWYFIKYENYLESYTNISINYDHITRWCEAGYEIGHIGEFFDLKILVHSQDASISRPVKRIVKSPRYVMIAEIAAGPVSFDFFIFGLCTPNSW